MERVKLEKLRRIVADHIGERVVVAFSGGVDSCLILALAIEAAKGTAGVCAVTMQTRLHPAAEIKYAARAAAELGAEHMVIMADELAEAGIEENPADRCYRCKRHLFQKMKERAAEPGGAQILEGTNADDLHVYRPGIRALRELGIISPLAMAGVTKEEVRSLARQYGLSAAGRASTPCMATRFPYGTKLSYDALDKAAQGEAYLKSLGADNVRLRVHGDTARIEVDPEAFSLIVSGRSEVVSRLKELGYTYVTLDLEGFRSGSMDVKVMRPDFFS